MFTVFRFSVLPNGTLLVYEVHMTDAGKYGCTAGNSGGFRREEVHLIVKSKCCLFIQAIKKIYSLHYIHCCRIL
jgi:hypothetical protein